MRPLSLPSSVSWTATLPIRYRARSTVSTGSSVRRRRRRGPGEIGSPARFFSLFPTPFTSKLIGFWLLVPPMESRQVARVPRLAKSGGAEVPVGADLAHYGPQVVPEVNDRRPPPKPIAVIDAVYNQTRLEHESVRNHRIVLRVGIFRDVQVFLNG